MKIFKVTSKHSSQGFTLIPLIFIIVMLGLIAVITLSSYQLQLVNRKIDQAALQTEQFFRAALAYYNDNSCWPLTQNSTQCQYVDSNFKDYLPTGILKNPWGGIYQYQPNAQNDFVVTLSKVPLSIGNRLASQLPNATANCNLSNCSITTSVQPPQAQSKIIITDIKTLNNQSDGDGVVSDSFNCPPGYLANMQVILQGMQANNAGKAEHLCNPYIWELSVKIGRLDSSNLNCWNDVGGKVRCSFNATAIAYRPHYNIIGVCAGTYDASNYGSVNYTYITYCQKIINPNSAF